MDNSEQAKTLNYYEGSPLKKSQLTASGLQNTNSPTRSPLKNDESPGKKPKNVQEHIGNVDVEFDQLKEGSIELGRLIEIEKLELERLRDTTNMTLEEFVNIIVAGADSCNKELQMHIEDQKQENLKMQSQITEIRKENSEIQQRIIMGGKTVEKILDVVGDYKD